MTSVGTKWGLSLLLLIVSPLTVIAQQAEIVPFPNYVSIQKRISLTPSKEYDAYAIAPEDMPVFEASVQQLTGIVVERSGLLDRMGIALVRRTTTASDGEFASSIAQLRASNTLFPVYEGEAGAMILINEFIVRFENDIQDRAAVAAFKGVGAQIVRKSEGIPNQYIVTFPSDDPIKALANANDMAAMPQYMYATPNFAVILPGPGNLQRLDPSITRGKPDSALMAPGNPGDWPNDDLYEQYQWALRAINAPTAWQTTIGSCDVSIAVLDSGIAMNHEDLDDKLVAGWDAVYSDDDPSPGLGQYHGTAVAGVAAAETNNDIGVAGTIWGGNIVAIRITDTSYFSGATNLEPNEHTNIEVVQTGIVKAVELHADVLNFSWIMNPSPAIETTIQEAIADSGKVIVAAVGQGTGNVAWPANMSTTVDLLGVGAFVYGGGIHPSSNHGPGDEVSLVAPGKSIATTDLYGNAGPSPDAYILSQFGLTSAATPFVSGAAALILSWLPGATPAEVIGWLKNHADDTGVADGDKEKFGAGRLDIGASITAIGTAGVVLDIALAPDKRLANGDITAVRVTATRNGHPLRGAMVRFESQDTELASVANSGEYVPTDCNGVVEAIVTGQSSTGDDATEIKATLADKAATVIVRVGSTNWLLRVVVPVALLLLVALWFWKRRRRPG